MIIMFVSFVHNFLPFRRNERERDDRGEKLTDFTMFFARRDLVFFIFPNFGRAF